MAKTDSEAQVAYSLTVRADLCFQWASSAQLLLHLRDSSDHYRRRHVQALLRQDRANATSASTLSIFSEPIDTLFKSNF